jgi:hypothetical protein
LQVSILLRFTPQILDRVHHRAFVLHHGLTKSLRAAVGCHHLQHGRILHQCLDRRIKRSAGTLRSRGNLIGKSGRGKDLGPERR